MMGSVTFTTSTVRRNGSRSRDVAILQSALAGKGFLDWKIDGIFGPLTEAAVKKFQAKAGLSQDGVVGPLTWASLSDPEESQIVAVPEASPIPPRLTEEDYQRVAGSFGLDVAIIKALVEVESSGDGFLLSGRPKILFEGHVFWKQLQAYGLDPSVFQPGNEDILYEKWTKEHYVGKEGEYTRLKKAMTIHEAAALKSASWGLFQIMGFNHALCGFDTVYPFVSAMYESESKQLDAFSLFIVSVAWDGKLLVDYLWEEDWTGFARGYNGPGYASNQYDTRLEEAVIKYRGPK